MDRLDELLSEAKPYYKTRKRNRRLMAIGSTLGAFIMVCGLSLQNFRQTQSPIYDLWIDEVYQAENGSVIEDLGLPVDEYGLLKVV